MRLPIRQTSVTFDDRLVGWMDGWLNSASTLRLLDYIEAAARQGYWLRWLRKAGENTVRTLLIGH